MERTSTTPAGNRGSEYKIQQLNNTTGLVSGIGQYHTNEYDPENPGKKLTPYLTIDLGGIRALVDTPQQVDKANAQWLIPSSYPSRTFKEQEQHGEYWLLWADLDKNPPKLSSIGDSVDTFLHGCDFELYNSRSATSQNQKARLLIFLDKPLAYADWHLAQGVLNDKLEALGIIPDRSNEGAAQLCYLPNKGELYDFDYARDGGFFDPLSYWAQEIAAKREKLEADARILQEEKQHAMAKREALKLTDAPDLIGAFNQVYTPGEWMLQAGYVQRGNSFRHPHSESGSFSATVKDGRVNALSTSDPLYSDGNGAHDAFSVYATLFHGGDINAAARCAGDNLLAIGGSSWNEAKQIEWAKEHGKAKPVESKFSLCRFSLSGQSEKMRLKMLEDKYVLDKLAILGQATVIYAKPNTGKTLLVLWSLIQSINKQEIDGKSVFYVNADDDHKGLVHKTSLAEQYGFHMLAPGFNGFESVALMGYMRQMIDDDTARGAVIILDTLKKFTDLMDKKAGSEFMSRAREFVSSGGSLIMLAHTNKNRNSDGKAVFGGTSDIMDDCDCGFILDEIDRTPTTKRVLFENIKSRGVVASALAFSYSNEEGVDYQHIFDSVRMDDKASAEQAKAERDAAVKLKNDKPAIDAIISAIMQGATLKTELVKAACADSGIGRRTIIGVLNDYTGDRISKGHIWAASPGEKAALVYCLLTKPATADEYHDAKNGVYL